MLYGKALAGVKTTRTTADDAELARIMVTDAQKIDEDDPPWRDDLLTHPFAPGSFDLVASVAAHPGVGLLMVRSKEFDRAFRPTSGTVRGRWQRIAEQCQRHEGGVGAPVEGADEDGAVPGLG